MTAGQLKIALSKKANNEKSSAEVKAKKEKKPRIKQTSEAVNAFATDARINDYGFLHFKTRWLEDLGWQKGAALEIGNNADGSITLRKVAKCGKEKTLSLYFTFFYPYRIVLSVHVL